MSTAATTATATMKTPQQVHLPTPATTVQRSHSINMNMAGTPYGAVAAAAGAAAPVRPGITPLAPSPMARLTEFFAALSPPPEQSVRLEYWHAVVNEYFTELGNMSYILRHSTIQDSRSFEVSVAILPRFFLVTFDSGVSRMEFSLRGVKEFQFETQTIISCPSAALTYHFRTGEQVYCVGSLRAFFNNPANQQTQQQPPKMDFFEFSTQRYTEIVPRDSAIMFAKLSESLAETMGRGGPEALQSDEERQRWNTHLAYMEQARRGEQLCGLAAESAVFPYGITVRTQRCLDIIEIVTHMRDLMSQTLRTGMSPIQCLQQYGNNNNNNVMPHQQHQLQLQQQQQQLQLQLHLQQQQQQQQQQLQQQLQFQQMQQQQLFQQHLAMGGMAVAGVNGTIAAASPANSSSSMIPQTPSEVAAYMQQQQQANGPTSAMVGVASDEQSSSGKDDVRDKETTGVRGGTKKGDGAGGGTKAKRAASSRGKK